jgi:hypothetical protein
MVAAAPDHALKRGSSTPFWRPGKRGQTAPFIRHQTLMTRSSIPEPS